MGIYFWKETMTKQAVKVARRHRRRRNSIARMLRDPLFRQRIIANKKKLLKSDRKNERLEVEAELRSFNEASRELE